jgi:hypothetical protein
MFDPKLKIVLENNKNILISLFLGSNDLCDEYLCNPQLAPDRNINQLYTSPKNNHCQSKNNIIDIKKPI